MPARPRAMARGARFFRWLEEAPLQDPRQDLLARYRRFVPCPACGGAKLKAEALNVGIGRVDDSPRSGSLRCAICSGWIGGLAQASRIGRARRACCCASSTTASDISNEVGLGYLTLERQARTLSGGEAQRIHLASALGSLLTGHALRARRADGRAACRRLAPAARRAAPSARPRQYRGGGRARSDDDRGRRLSWSSWVPAAAARAAELIRAGAPAQSRERA